MKKARGEIRRILIVVGKIQSLAGKAQGVYFNDRQANRADALIPILQEMFDLCLDILGDYDPILEKEMK